MSGTYVDVGGPQVLDLFVPELHKAFGETLPLDVYRERIVRRLKHPWARKSLRVLVLRDDRGSYLSHLHLCAMPALHFDREIWMGGIASLVTPERIRRQGHASTLLRLTLELLAREGVDGAFLFSDIGAGLFTPLGFRTVAATKVEVPLAALPREAGAGTAVRAIREGDRPVIASIHRKAGAGQWLWFLRDAQRWDDLMDRWTREERSARFLGRVALVRGTVAGYILALAEGESIRLLEFGMEVPERPLLDALLAALRADGEAAGCSRIIFPRPPGTWGAMLHPSIAPVASRQGLLMVASLGSGIDLSAIAEPAGGYWEADRI